ncbi:MAG: hypothetical protein ABSF87_18265 [Xanthobacteraceae bacterium]
MEHLPWDGDLRPPEPIKHWSLTSLKEKLIKIGAKVVRHGRYVANAMLTFLRLPSYQCFVAVPIS